MQESAIIFKEWLPDLPDLDNPGLTEAKNVIPTNSVYAPFRDLVSASTALSANPVGAFRANSTAGSEFIVGTGTQIYKASGTQWTAASAAIGSATYWRFTQYDDLVIAVSDGAVPLARTIGSATTFGALATTGTAPTSQQIAKIGQFVVLGDRNNAEPHSIQWSAINDPRNWPTPGSTTAIASQSGEQLLRSEFGTVNGISSGDQFGLVFQSGGITRMTYVGGSTVFQFDEISEGVGCYYPNSIVQVGNVVYFATLTGLYRTNGTQIENIGDSKVNRYFTTRVDYIYAERVYAGIDWINKCIYWSYPVSGDSGVPSKLLIYNFVENRFTRAETVANSIAHSAIANATTFGMEAFNSSRQRGQMGNTSHPSGGGTVLQAILTTGETSLNPGGFAHVSGVKAYINGADDYTVALGTRNDYSTASASFTSETTATARTGFCDFRSAAVYHRARVTINETFNSIQGASFLWQEAGDT